MKNPSLKIAVSLAFVSALAMPSAASAQLGGLGGLTKKVVGGGSAVSGDEADAFLTRADDATLNVMVAALVIASAVDTKKEATKHKLSFEALQKAHKAGELDTQLDAFRSNVQALNALSSDAAPFEAAYKAANAEQKKMLGLALVNLAIGVARNVELAGKAPGVVNAVTRNPQLLARAGQFRKAAKLVSAQAQGLSGFATTLPKLMLAAKVKSPPQPGEAKFGSGVKPL